MIPGPMAPLPVIANVYRIAVLWNTVAGVTPRNIFHVKCTASSDLQEIVDVIGAAGDSTGVNMWNVCSSSLVATALQITPLDGSTAGVDLAMPTSWTGAQADSQVPSTAAVVSFHTAQRGPRGRGRVYVGPACESTIVSGSLVGANQALMLASWDYFHDTMLADTPSVQLGVASYVHGDFHPIASIRVDNLVGTQRRRQDQLR